MSRLHQNISSREWTQLRVAAIYLFGTHRALSDDFWSTLSRESVRQAFRRQARRFHPDLQSRQSPEVVQERRDWFIKVKDSYELLKSFLADKHPEPRRGGAKKIIAVGGAKGGIGKSMFSANLGVWLASQGYRTVVIDLDLGGANLHLYLGQTFLQRNINDFLSQQVPLLTDLIIPTRYGPSLIGGNSSQLGAANVSFTTKMRLIKAIQNLEADYVVIDLGSGTSFNITDFFLCADVKIIVTTCDPAAYLEAYNLIKVGLYRGLNQVGGDGAALSVPQLVALKQFIHQATMSPNGHRVKTMQELEERLTQHYPDYVPRFQSVLHAYRPYLVVNKVENTAQVAPIVRRIQEVAGRILSIQVNYMGTIPSLNEIRKSTRELMPAVARNGRGLLAQKIAQMARLFHQGWPGGWKQ